MELKKIFVILLIIILLIIFIYLYNNINQKPESKKSKIQPFSTNVKNDCTVMRIECDPKIVNPCSSLCNNDIELQCQREENDPKGFVCAPPKPPIIDCQSDKGGIMVWSGYGFTDNMDWSCLCTQPGYFNGIDCKNKNPGLCTGGTFDVSKKGFSNESCTCPENTKKMIDSRTNLAFCANTNPIQGGLYGLAGNKPIYPAWESIYFNINTNDNYDSWVRRISDELYIGNYNQTLTRPKILQILIENNDLKLKKETALKLCDFTNMPNANKSGLCDIKFPENYDPISTYTYFPYAHFPNN